MLKKTKKEVLDDIRNAAYAAASGANNMNLTVDSYQLQSAIKLNGQYQIQQAIADAVTASFTKLIENTYFEAEFEQDIGLKP
jgi:hypothetical protein